MTDSHTRGNGVHDRTVLPTEQMGLGLNRHINDVGITTGLSDPWRSGILRWLAMRLEAEKQEQGAQERRARADRSDGTGDEPLPGVHPAVCRNGFRLPR